MVRASRIRSKGNFRVHRTRQQLGDGNRITRTIYDTVHTLGVMPNRGRNGRIESTRELMVPRLPYFVVYRVGGERVLVLNIVHGARRWP